MTEPRPPKKSESLEIRIPYPTKQAFMERCREEGVSASEVLRGLIETRLQPAPFPETAIAGNAEWFLFEGMMRGQTPPFADDAFEDYKAAARRPSVIHAMCEDYRAGASYDVAADEADRGKKKIDCPVQILWGGKGALGAWYDVLGLWREWADDVTGEAIDCGHFIPEEKPVETLAALRAFFLG